MEAMCSAIHSGHLSIFRQTNRWFLAPCEQLPPIKETYIYILWLDLLHKLSIRNVRNAVGGWALPQIPSFCFRFKLRLSQCEDYNKMARFLCETHICQGQNMVHFLIEGDDHPRYTHYSNWRTQFISQYPTWLHCLLASVLCNITIIKPPPHG